MSKRYWYYATKPDGVDDRRIIDRLPAGPLERIVHETIRRYLTDQIWLASASVTAGVRPEAIAAAFERAGKKASGSRDANNAEALSDVIHRADLRDRLISVEINLAPLLDNPEGSEVPAPPIEVPI